MSGVFVLVPLVITDAMLSSSTIAEPAAGETAWNAATNYAQGDRVIRTTTHRVYENIIAGVNATPPELTIADAIPRWVDVDPTNKWAAFDGQVNTPSSVTSPLTYVLRPGIFNAIALYGIVGDSCVITLKDSVGGSVVYTSTTELISPPVDHYDYYFPTSFKQLSKVFIKDLVPYADPELTITITVGAGVAKIGLIAIGDLRSLTTEGGGTQYGASAKPITYSYISTDAFGKTKIVRRASATDMDINVILSNGDSDTALLTLQDVLDVPAAWIGSDASTFAGLNVFGLASGTLSYEGPTHSIMSLSIKGFI
jgi:hypothetical protein